MIPPCLHEHGRCEIDRDEPCSNIFEEAEEMARPGPHLCDDIGMRNARETDHIELVEATFRAFSESAGSAGELVYYPTTSIVLRQRPLPPPWKR